jgi:hypothetical protein
VVLSLISVSCDNFSNLVAPQAAFFWGMVDYAPQAAFFFRYFCLSAAGGFFGGVVDFGPRSGLGFGCVHFDAHSLSDTPPIPPTPPTPPMLLSLFSFLSLLSPSLYASMDTHTQTLRKASQKDIHNHLTTRTLSSLYFHSQQGCKEALKQSFLDPLQDPGDCLCPVDSACAREGFWLSQQVSH